MCFRSCAFPGGSCILLWSVCSQNLPCTRLCFADSDATPRSHMLVHHMPLHGPKNQHIPVCCLELQHTLWVSRFKQAFKHQKSLLHVRSVIMRHCFCFSNYFSLHTDRVKDNFAFVHHPLKTHMPQHTRTFKAHTQDFTKTHVRGVSNGYVADKKRRREEIKNNNTRRKKKQKQKTTAKTN